MASLAPSCSHSATGQGSFIFDGRLGDPSRRTMRKNDLSHQRLIPRRPTCDVARNSPVGLKVNEVGGDENVTWKDETFT